MADLDLTAAIEAGARAAWENRDIPPTPTWEGLHEVERRAYRVSVAAAVTGAAPAILRTVLDRLVVELNAEHAKQCGTTWDSLSRAVQVVRETVDAMAPSASQGAHEGESVAPEAGSGAEGSGGATAGRAYQALADQVCVPCALRNPDDCGHEPELIHAEEGESRG